MSEYQFTKDWFGWAPPVWEQLVPMLPERTEDGRSFLEIGSFEGRSTVWTMEHMMQDGDYINCIDTWGGGEEHGEEDMSAVWDRFCHNTALAFKRFPNRYFENLKGTSYERLADLVGFGMRCDFIYIDGSHIAKDVLTDACMAWPLLKPKGIMVFDDYVWGDPRDILHRPKAAIDAFTNIFAEEVEVIHVGYQLVVRKKGE
jgi:predicted O-methyltransferase YrrM